METFLIMRRNLTFFKAVGVSCTILLLLPTLKADFRVIQTSSTDLPARPSLEPRSYSLHSSSSIPHKIIHQYGFHLHAQPSKSGASNLHKIIQRLGHFRHFSRQQPNNPKNNTSKEETQAQISLSLKNARLKRQLEGIFHVRGTPTSTSVPILSPIPVNNKASRAIHNDQNYFNKRNNVNKTTEKEILEEEILKSNNKYPTTISKNVGFTDTDVPRPIKDKRNFTVEIIETSRKTLIKQDSSDEDDTLPHAEEKKNIDSKASLQNINFLKPASLFNPTRARLRFKNFRPPSQLKILNDNQNSQTQATTKEPVNEIANEPRISKPFKERKQFDDKPHDKSVEVKVNYQEQIPYNERDIDESDLKDYLDGHSTFGSKGDFKHTVSRNVTGFLPNHRKNGHEVHKRTPQSTGSGNSPRTRGGQVNIERASVKQMNNQPGTTVYTASRPNEVADPEDDTKAVYEYQGNRETPQNLKKPEIPKNTESFHELFRQGHPGILKAPQPIYKGHPLGEPYGQSHDNDDHENPFRANPLVDEPPLKFDPESDRFYGDPTPEKDKRLAQSNRPEPVRIENAENHTPEYQEKERPSTTEPINDNNDDQYYNQRDYEPNDFDYERATDIGDKETDPYIRDFVSLDSNFERLPRPSAADESFRSLVPPEAEDDTNNEYFDEPDRKNNYRERERDYDTRPRDPDEDSVVRNEERRGNSRQNDRTPTRQKSDDDFSDENRDSREGIDGNDNRSDEGDSTREDFDPSYVDALNHFDEEIKRIQENDRRGITTGNPMTTTREPPLVITSPGPVVPYPPRENLQRPTHSTTPIDESRESEENDDERERDNEQNNRHDQQINQPEEQTNRPDEPTNHPDDNDDRNPSTEKSEDAGEEDEEEPEEPEQNSQSTTSKNTDDQERESDKNKEADGTRKKRMGVKITRSLKNLTSSNKPGGDKSGNLDEDIISIEKEFGRFGTI